MEREGRKGEQRRWCVLVSEWVDKDARMEMDGMITNEIEWEGRKWGTRWRWGVLCERVTGKGRGMDGRSVNGVRWNGKGAEGWNFLGESSGMLGIGGWMSG